MSSRRLYMILSRNSDIRWLALSKAFAVPREATVSVGRAQYVELLIAQWMRLLTSGAPQRLTLKLASPTRPLVAVRRRLHSRHDVVYTHKVFHSLQNMYNATYMSQTRDQQRFTISEVAADWHEPVVPQRIMWPSTARANGKLDPWCS